MVGATSAPEEEAPEHVEVDPEHSDRPSRPRPSAAFVALAIVALLGIFGTVFFYSKYRSLSGRGKDQTAVTKVSQDFLLALTNFNANTIDDTVKKLQSYSTGDFQGQALNFFSSDFRQAAAKVQATSRGQIRDLYVESIDAGAASTYADVDQTIANLNFARPEQDQLRIVLTLKKLSQGWRISEVTVLQAPTSPAPGSSTSPTTTAAPTPATTAAP